MARPWRDGWDQVWGRSQESSDGVQREVQGQSPQHRLGVGTELPKPRNEPQDKG